MMRLPNDFYRNPAHRDTLWSNLTGPVNCRAGTQKVVQVFITNASNVFLLEPSEKDGLLEEQVYFYCCQLEYMGFLPSGERKITIMMTEILLRIGNL